MKLEVTKEELDVLNVYQNETNFRMNQLFEEKAENDILALLQNQQVEYSKEALIEDINRIKEIYTIILKNFRNYAEEEEITFYQKVNFAIIDKWKKDGYINPFLLMKKEILEETKETENSWNRASYFTHKTKPRCSIFRFRRKRNLDCAFYIY